MKNELKNSVAFGKIEQSKNIRDLLHAQASVFSLITQFSMRPCPKLAQFIVRHFRLLVEHPSAREDQELYQQHLKLLNHWVEISQYLIEQRKSSQGQASVAIH